MQRLESTDAKTIFHVTGPEKANTCKQLYRARRDTGWLAQQTSSRIACQHNPRRRMPCKLSRMFAYRQRARVISSLVANDKILATGLPKVQEYDRIRPNSAPDQK